jgi:hypothetical protein
MADNRDKSSNQENQTTNHQSLAENSGISANLEDFGGGRGQTAGVQESASSQDQFSEDVMQLADESDFEDKAIPQPPYDYFDDKDKK